MDAFSTSPLGTRLPNLDSAVVALMLAGTFSMAPARAEPAEAFAAATIDELKIAYLGCSRSALDGGLSKPGIMGCSVVYEELKRRAFDGDFERLLAWSRAQDPMQKAEGARQPAILSVAEASPALASRQP